MSTLISKLDCGCICDIISVERATKNEIRNFKARAKRNKRTYEKVSGDSFKLVRCKPHQKGHEAYLLEKYKGKP